MSDAGWHVGVGQRQNPFLQIPLHVDYHVGAHGVDTGMGSASGVRTWEDLFGAQMAMLEWVDEQLAYPVSIFELAKAWQRTHRSKVRRL